MISTIIILTPASCGGVFLVTGAVSPSKLEFGALAYNSLQDFSHIETSGNSTRINVNP
jgi:hypothetical protein